MTVEEQTFAAKCREHWERLKLSNPETLKQRIIEVFTQTRTSRTLSLTSINWCCRTGTKFRASKDTRKSEWNSPFSFAANFKISTASTIRIACREEHG